MPNKNNFLFIGDVHIPFEHPRALEFCKSLKKDFDIPHENIYSVGDITDLYHFGRWPKSPDARHTINQELDQAREVLRKWARAFPELKLAESNHDSRILKKSLSAELPSQVIKSFREIFELPDSWQIKDQFVICGPDILVCHGEEFNCALQAAIHYGLNVVQGHWHNKFGVQYRASKMQQLWGAATGWLGDQTQYCFEYGKHSKQKMILGSIVVVDGIPYPIPLK
jgi:UDP-2,3-diacylglucosamine pyrophosphatase LpxH